MKKSAFIDDGYTIEAYLEETDDSPRIEFSYRRRLNPDIQRHLARWRYLNEHGQTDEAVDLMYKFTAATIIGWSLDGKPSSENMRRLNGETFGKLYAVALGSEPDGVTNGEMLIEEDMAKNSMAG